MKRSFVLTAEMILLIGVTWVFLSPYFALHYLGQAALRGDLDDLNQTVDFPALRTSLKAQLNARLVAEAGKRRGGFEPLGNVMAQAMVNPMIDQYLTPEVIVTVIQRRLDNNQRAALAAAADRLDDLFRGSDKTSISQGYVSLNRFDVEMSKPGESESLKLVFLRSDLIHWRLSEIRLDQAIRRTS